MAVEFDGVDDFINTNNTMTLSNITVFFWVCKDNDDAFHMMVTRDNTGTGNWYIVNAGDGSGKLEFSGQFDAGFVNAVKTTNAIGTGVWHPIMVTHDATGAQVVYVDGVNDGTGNETGNLDSTDIVEIGARKSGTDLHFDGKISEVAIWDTFLNQTEATLLANSRIKGMPFQIRPANLVMYLPLNDVADGVSGDAVTFVDRSGNGNDGIGSSPSLTCQAETILSYQPHIIVPGISAVAPPPPVVAGIMTTRTKWWGDL